MSKHNRCGIRFNGFAKDIPWIDNSGVEPSSADVDASNETLRVSSSKTWNSSRAEDVTSLKRESRQTVCESAVDTVLECIDHAISQFDAFSCKALTRPIPLICRSSTSACTSQGKPPWLSVVSDIETAVRTIRQRAGLRSTPRQRVWHAMLFETFIRALRFRSCFMPRAKVCSFSSLIPMYIKQFLPGFAV